MLAGPASEAGGAGRSGAAPEAGRRRRRRRSGARRVLLWLGACSGGLGTILLGLMALVLVGTLGETESADSPTLANRIEQLIRTDETLHYQVHMTAGRVLTLLPRTRGLGVEQYRKASFHAPEAVRARKALLQKFPDAAVQVDALLTCQQFLTERLRQSGQVPAFPAIDSLERGDLERAVMPQADGQANVVQVVLVRDARAPEDSSVGLDYLVYVCDVRTNVMGSLSLVDLVLLNGRPPA